MSFSDWIRRHRWLISERPRIDASGNENLLLEEFGKGTGRVRPPAAHTGPGGTAIGSVSRPGLPESEADLAADDVIVA